MSTTQAQTQTGVKVFVGNLAFKTNQAQLAEVFKSCGKILDANIISRGRRSMGYGFVTFENLTDANNAVSSMHHKEIDGRQVNVEVARPKQEKPANQQNNNNQGGNNNNNNNNNQGGQQTGGFRSIRRNTNYRGRGRGRFNNRGPRNFNNDNNNNNNQGGNQVQNNNNNNNQGRIRRPRRNFVNRNQNAQNNNQGQNNGKQEQGQPRQPRQPKPQVEKTPSKTTLFVANLPWSVTDETFGQFLTKESIKFKKAFVARRRNGRSLGYGFVEFDTEDEQTKGITSIEKKQIDGRELTAKVALTDLSKMNLVNNNNNNNNATTTTTTTTASTSTTPATTTTTAEKK